MPLDKFMSNREDFIFPICNNCKHKYKGSKCKAFAIIPRAILEGGSHNKVFPDQTGSFIFEKKS